MAGKRILLATHQEAVNEVVGKLLTSAGYEVKMTLHPSEVIAIAESFRPEVVFTELIMPEIDGVKLGEELAHRFPGLKIVFIDESEEFIARHLRDRGVFCDFLKPPFEKQDLFDLVSNLMPGSDHCHRP
jgi:DNA-binding NtrC family response regulator